mmetsp:Transcript_20190/g.51210  ORF Transcript_20190/g.51210 Transcript_20190/m.51210 type:complete len:311 (+) Transcript_20190:388-1320(+)
MGVWPILHSLPLARARCSSAHRPSRCNWWNASARVPLNNPRRCRRPVTRQLRRTSSMATLRCAPSSRPSSAAPCKSPPRGPPPPVRNPRHTHKRRLWRAPSWCNLIPTRSAPLPICSLATSSGLANRVAGPVRATGRAARTTSSMPPLVSSSLWHGAPLVRLQRPGMRERSATVTATATTRRPSLLRMPTLARVAFTLAMTRRRPGSRAPGASRVGSRARQLRNTTTNSTRLLCLHRLEPAPVREWARWARTHRRAACPRTASNSRCVSRATRPSGTRKKTLRPAMRQRVPTPVWRLSRRSYRVLLFCAS